MAINRAWGRAQQQRVAARMGHVAFADDREGVMPRQSVLSQLQTSRMNAVAEPGSFCGQIIPTHIKEKLGQTESCPAALPASPDQSIERMICLHNILELYGVFDFGTLR